MSAGFVYEVQPRVLAATGYAYAHCHNGYLEVLIAFGYVGLGICLAVIIWLFDGSWAACCRSAHASWSFEWASSFVIVMYALGAKLYRIASLITESCYAVVLLALAAGLATRARLEDRELRERTRSLSARALAMYSRNASKRAREPGLWTTGWDLRPAST